MANVNQDVFFSKNLILENTGTGREAYKDLIVYLRQRLIGSRYFHDHPNSPLAQTWNSHNLPVLRPELKEDPIPWFELVLQTMQNRVTFKLRRDNLYLVGYQVQGNERWREFTETKDGVVLPYLIPNCIPLPFGGSYLNLKEYGGISLQKTYVGQRALSDAVDHLATATTTDAVKAQSLIVVIFIISESIRFRHVSDFVISKYLGSSRVESDEHQLADLVTDWDTLSSALLRVDAGFKFYLNEPQHKRIKKELDAVAALGILKYTSFRIQ